eukprot:Ihof_evm1s458 gene=Ihof_evmTU1s458
MVATSNVIRHKEASQTLQKALQETVKTIIKPDHSNFASFMKTKDFEDMAKMDKELPYTVSEVSSGVVYLKGTIGGDRVDMCFDIRLPDTKLGYHGLSAHGLDVTARIIKPEDTQLQLKFKVKDSQLLLKKIYLSSKDQLDIQRDSGFYGPRVDRMKDIIVEPMTNYLESRGFNDRLARYIE